jgi:hypothetical protein
MFYVMCRSLGVDRRPFCLCRFQKCERTIFVVPRTQKVPSTKKIARNLNSKQNQEKNQRTTTTTICEATESLTTTHIPSTCHPVYIRIESSMTETEDTAMLGVEGAAEAPATEETAASTSNSNSNGGVVSSSVVMDPLQRQPSPIVREGDFCILAFGDGRQIFAHCVVSWKGKSPPVKINKRSYTTANLIGLPYGTVLEVERSRLVPLPATEDLKPEFPSAAVMAAAQRPDKDDAKANDDFYDASEAADAEDGDDTTMPAVAVAAPQQERERDNRHIVDNNTSQSMDLQEIARLRETGVQGSTIVEKVRVPLLTFTTHVSRIYTH